MDSIILHCCCGPCATSSIEKLIEDQKKPILYYSNSNINNIDEFEKRLLQLEKVADFFKVPLFSDPYNHNEWLKTVKGLENLPEGGDRCKICFRYNLFRTSLFSKNQNNLPFTTTLTVSPHKNSNLIFDIGTSFNQYKPYNFKKKEGFKRSNEISKSLNLYRQTYCGCEFSKRERNI